MRLSPREIMNVINRLESDYYRVYKSPDRELRDKKFAFHALLTLERLKEKIKDAGDKNQIW